MADRGRPGGRVVVGSLAVVALAATGVAGALMLPSRNDADVVESSSVERADAVAATFAPALTGR